jgi:hypothetical protein
MCERCDELLEELRQLRESIAPVEFVAPPEWRLTFPEDKLFRAFRARGFLTTDGILASTRTAHKASKPQWDIGAPKNLTSVYIVRLRRKLRDAKAPYRIVTIPSTGYKLESLA